MWMGWRGAVRPVAVGRLFAVLVACCAAAAATSDSSGHRVLPPPARHPSLIPYHRQQAVWCRKNYEAVKLNASSYNMELVTSAGINTAAFKEVAQLSVYAYSSTDIVSQFILNRQGWEAGRVSMVLDHLEQFRVKHQLKREEVTFVDIGANIGWFSLVAAQAGFHVLAFEPMPANEVLFRSSMCHNKLGHMITYINKGLGKEPANCTVFSPSLNKGNGIVVCDGTQDSKEGFSTVNGVLQRRGTINIGLLDELVPPETAETLRTPFLKMDTEGFEALVVAGGRKFFSRPVMTHFFMELNIETRDLRKDFLSELSQLGISVSRESFGGAAYDGGDMSASMNVVDIYGLKAAAATLRARRALRSA